MLANAYHLHYLDSNDLYLFKRSLFITNRLTFSVKGHLSLDRIKIQLLDPNEAEFFMKTTRYSKKDLTRETS